MFIFNADIYCDDCGLDIIRRIERYGGKHEPGMDSDDWPHRIATAEATDTPEHCGAGSACKNAITLPGWHEPIGEILNDDLTDYGREYVRECHAERPTPVTEFWIEHYGVEL